MLVTREWLESVSDEKGLTRGQQELLNNHAGGLPYVGSLLDDEIARHVALCKGWRKTRADVLLMRQKNGA